MKAKKPIKRGHCLTVIIRDARWEAVRGLKPRLEAVSELVLATLLKQNHFLQVEPEMALLLTTNAEVRRLNHNFRGLDKPTNVLSFPQYTGSELRQSLPSSQPLHLGDIAIAYAYTKEEARRDGKEFLDHVSHLMIHGLLHLLGYDHITLAKAARMERLEKKLMAAMGLADPYVPPVRKKPKVKKNR